MRQLRIFQKMVEKGLLLLPSSPFLEFNNHYLL